MPKVQRSAPRTQAPAPEHASPCPRNEVALGDCIESMKQWSDGQIDLIFADPPYNIGFEYDDHYIDRRSDEEYVQWCGQWVEQCARLLKPSGSLFILIGDEYAAEMRLILKSLEKQGRLVFRNWIVWHYTFGQNCKYKFNRSHAHLFYCVGSAAAKSGSLDSDTDGLPFTFNRQAIAIPSARLTTYADTRANPKGKLPDDTWYLRPQATLDDIGRHYLSPDMDTWYQSRLCGTFKERVGWHPCQLPEALLERIVLLSSNPGDLVFDPFLGSGTTAAVARRFQRDWLGCELGEVYARNARDRIQAVVPTDDVSPSAIARWLEERGGKTVTRSNDGKTPTKGRRASTPNDDTAPAKEQDESESQPQLWAD
ncbi:MAG: site-specific DNA-methyltransferase [Phycisphaeraceae bacterium]|nr:site-specific DNA-methyltransferase [Phycisphaeraceae bacterium]